MSGITGIVNFGGQPVSSALLAKMTDQVAYRGPHGVSYLTQEGVGLGHLALHSTPESEFEKQPLVHPETGVILVADARVDNRNDLLHSLSLSGEVEKPVTDADIIMAAYLRWGREAAKSIIGDFAFLLWDPRKQGVYAARDPMGIRNLHFAFTGRTLLVASEAQQILQYPTISNELNESAVIEWAIGHVTSGYCMFKDINVLQAGSCLWADADGYQVEQFWDVDPSISIRYKNNSDYAEHFIEVLSNAVEVRLRTRSKVVGAELSGGMDSTTVVALAKRILDKRGSSIKAVSYQFPNTPICDETDYIQSVANHLSIETYFLNGETQGVLEYPIGNKHTLESPWIRDIPLMDHECLFLREQGAEVLLTGCGGDEVATGGGSLLRYRLWQGDFRVLIDLIRYCKQYQLSIANTAYRAFIEPYFPNCLDRVLRALLRKNVRNKRACPSWISSSASERLNLLERYYSPLKRKQFRNMASQEMYNNLVDSTTRSAYGAYELMAAHYGLEVRHPFLDQNVIEFCFAVPVSLWNQRLYSKWLLRYATKSLLPDDIRWRYDKTGANEILGKAMVKNMGYIMKVLNYNHPKLTGLYDSEILKQEFETHFQQANCVTRGDIDFALSLQCWLHTNRKILDI